MRSSIRWRVMAIWKRGVFHPRLGLWVQKFLQIFVFFVHNFGYRYARKSFKGSEDVDFGVVSKQILSQNNGSMGWSPGPSKGGKKNNNTPTCSGLPIERQTESEKRFFRFQLEDLLNPWMVSIAL